MIAGNPDPKYMPGTEGYAEHADTLVATWQRLSLADKPPEVLELVPRTPSVVIDIGAGIGMDAAGLAALGHRIIAVEPVENLRDAGRGLHTSSAIEWVADGLPYLAAVIDRGPVFDLAMLSAVWMHLDQNERRVAMPRVASLLRPGGRMILSLRHGPVPKGRRMFAVTAEETIELAAAERLSKILQLEAESAQRLNQSQGVTWTHLVFDKGGPPRD